MNNDIDIILFNEKNVIYYKEYKTKNSISSYIFECDLIMILKSPGYFNYFFITKDNKYLILIYYINNFEHNIDFYLIKKVQKNCYIYKYINYKLLLI